MKIYHNPGCKKSREVLELLKTKINSLEIIDYTKSPLGFEDIKLILIQLKIAPIKLIRQKEKIWKENYKNKNNITDNEIIQAMVKYPKLIERPIAIKNEKAIIGRPPENVLKLLN